MAPGLKKFFQILPALGLIAILALPVNAQEPAPPGERPPPPGPNGDLPPPGERPPPPDGEPPVNIEIEVGPHPGPGPGRGPGPGGRPR